VSEIEAGSDRIISTKLNIRELLAAQ